MVSPEPLNVGVEPSPDQIEAGHQGSECPELVPVLTYSLKPTSSSICNRMDW